MRSRWTGLPTKVFDVRVVEFTSLCESGHAVSSVVEGITSDGFVYNDTNQAEVEYGCLDMIQGDLIAWTCTGMISTSSDNLHHLHTTSVSDENLPVQESLPVSPAPVLRNAASQMSSLMNIFTVSRLTTTLIFGLHRVLQASM